MTLESIECSRLGRESRIEWRCLRCYRTLDVRWCCESMEDSGNISEKESMMVV